MTAIQTTSPAPNSALQDLSKGEITENIILEEPPRYEFVNPSAFNNQNNYVSGTLRYQPHWITIDNSGSTTTMLGTSSKMNPQISHIKNYKTWSIFNALCCCLCLGLVAFHYSKETEILLLRNDIRGAFNTSRKARRINIITTVLGIILLIVYIVLCIVSMKQ
ncbi:unnamed protein product [Rotaria sordida]|uniref:Uncharacterized protein n=1 Tax=Rotaria sordida TaxID=392033 RepID=A0A819NWY0_9BILA|nr:unnamed protein product [Rotaria sordida]CAF4003562.1 unnamed protein product [Rotaria sordida]